MAKARTVRAARGAEISCKGWVQEAALRMLCNNLDPDVAERPDELVVYGGTRKAREARTGARRSPWLLTAGLGGMGGAQPLAAVMAGISCLAVEVDPARIEKRLATRYVDERIDDLDAAL